MANWIAELAAIARTAFEIVGIVVILLGSLFASFQAASAFVGGGDRSRIVPKFRSSLGRSILIGLELLVAGDIINTVAFEPTFNSVGVLAVIVLIRTFLSISIQVEIDGKWPWQRAATKSPAPEPSADPGRPSKLLRGGD